MKPVFQTRFGTDGNCWPACLASYFEVPLEEVDHCAAANPEWRENTDRFLADRGMFYLEISIRKAGFSEFPAGALFIAGVTSPSGLLHAVIAEARINGRTVEFWVIHDPLNPPAGATYDLEHLILFCHLSK